MSAMFPITGRRIPLMGLALIIGSVVGISLYTRPSQIGESAAGSQRWHEWMLDSLKYGGSSSCPSATVGPPQEYQWVAEMPTEYGGGYRQFQHTWNHCKSCPTRTIVSRPALQTELRDIEPDSVIPIPQIDSSYSDDAITDASDMVDTESLTGAVVWLVPASKMLMALGSLESLALYMPMENRYKFIFMHEGDLGSPVYQQEVKDQWLERAHQVEESNAPLAAKMRAMGEDIEFMLVDLHVPNDVAQLARAGEFKDVIYGNRWPGYQNMCRFFAYDIFWHPRIRQFDYYMRMDVDSYMLTPMAKDPFRRMRDRGVVYGYRGTEMEIMHYIMGFGPLVGEYAKQHGDAAMEQRIIDAKIPTIAGTPFPLYYNNFELVHTASFRTAKVAGFLNHLKENVKSFYTNRWGDACTRYATVNMFFRPDQIHKFEDWGYFHWPHTYKLPADEERDRLEKERKEKEEAEKEKAET